MVPPAISVIHCHLRWQNGSLWHWPLLDPTLSRGRPIELGVTPFSDIRIYLRGGVAAEGESNGWILQLLVHWRKEEGGGGGGEGVGWWWSCTMFCLPQEAGDFFCSGLHFTGPPSVSLPHFCLPPFHSTSRNQNRHGMWWRRPFPGLRNITLVEALVEAF